jgi:nicotinamidase-related amidase
MPRIGSHAWRPGSAASLAAPRCDTAVLIVDAISDLEGEDGESFAEHALAAAENLAQLCERARAAAIAVIFAGGARDLAGFRALVRHCQTDRVRGARIAVLLNPDGDDYFVPVVDAAGLPAPALDLLLEDLGVQTLIVAGNAPEACTLFGNNEGRLRDYNLIVPADCLMAAADEDAFIALYFMRNTLNADLTAAEELEFTAQPQ